MKRTAVERISNELRESRIDWKVALFFIPVAFLTYYFHESGHWLLGELWGNEMMISLNNAAPQNGHFLNESGALASAIGGPLFTIIQAVVFCLITWKTKSVYTYSVVFFAVFSRFFSIIFGGITLQDEAGIARLLHTNMYLIAAVVLIILSLILWGSSRAGKIPLKSLGYYCILGVFADLLVIGVNKFIF
jgi:hypothetical protein